MNDFGQLTKRPRPQVRQAGRFEVNSNGRQTPPVTFRLCFCKQFHQRRTHHQTKEQKRHRKLSSGRPTLPKDCQESCFAQQQIPLERRKRMADREDAEVKQPQQRKRQHVLRTRRHTRAKSDHRPDCTDELESGVHVHVERVGGQSDRVPTARTRQVQLHETAVDAKETLDLNQVGHERSKVAPAQQRQKQDTRTLKTWQTWHGRRVKLQASENLFLAFQF
jgi:hypothetical protein